MIRIGLLLAALVVFIIAAIGIATGRYSLIAVGFALFTAAFLFADVTP